MTQEEKEVLLKDLCARLPYGVKLKRFDGEIVELTPLLFATFAIENFKPYLRPMSSMTEEEKREYFDVTQVSNHCAAIDWLNAHHFDYRGLIEKGLALEVHEGMYK